MIYPVSVQDNNRFTKQIFVVMIAVTLEGKGSITIKSKIDSIIHVAKCPSTLNENNDL